MPLGKDVGANIREEKKAHPEMKQKQAVAIGLNAARKAGAKIPMPKSKRPGIKKK